jgi:hypothetical protein
MREPRRGGRVGIVGAGRLGSALAFRLARQAREVVLYDRDPAAARRAAAGGRVRWVRRPERLLASAGAILLCLPPAEIEPFLARHHDAVGGATPVCNLATSLSTAALRRSPGAAGLDLVALKPVGQFLAIRFGLPTLFVTEPRERRRLAALQELVAPLGVVVAGDEEAVGRLNRLATLQALSTCVTFLREGEALGFPAALLEAALHNVVAGTILDFPPEAGDGYAQELLAGLGRASAAGGGRR